MSNDSAMSDEELKKLLGTLVQGGATYKTAFPLEESSKGMNLLEYFTAAALTGILTRSDIKVDAVGRYAVEQAAKTLAELRRMTGVPTQ